MMFEPIVENTQKAKIKVIGVGGGGCNVINHLAETADTSDIELFAINTDAQALKNSHEKVQTVQIGANTTKGLG